MRYVRCVGGESSDAGPLGVDQIPPRPALIATIDDEPPTVRALAFVVAEINAKPLHVDRVRGARQWLRHRRQRLAQLRPIRDRGDDFRSLEPGAGQPDLDQHLDNGREILRRALALTPPAPAARRMRVVCDLAQISFGGPGNPLQQSIDPIEPGKKRFLELGYRIPLSRAPMVIDQFSFPARQTTTESHRRWRARGWHAETGHTCRFC